MSIRAKIILSSFGLITLFFFAILSILIFHNSSISAYKQVNTRLALEHTLSENVDDLMETHNELSVAPTNEVRHESYVSQRERILTTLEELDRSIVETESLVVYRGLKNIVDGIIRDLDSAVQALLMNDLVSSSQHYSQAVQKESFLESNVSKLLLTQIESLKEVQDEIDIKYNQQRIMALALIAVIIGLATLFSFLFADNISKPIKTLSNISKKVTAGDFTSPIPDGLSKSRDEVGELAHSFSVMLTKLKETIAEIKGAQKELKERNDELERFQKIAVDRELKMIKLKEEIKNIREK